MAPGAGTGTTTTMMMMIMMDSKEEVCAGQCCKSIAGVDGDLRSIDQRSNPQGHPPSPPHEMNNLESCVVGVFWIVCAR